MQLHTATIQFTLRSSSAREIPEHSGTFENFRELSGTIWNILEHSQTFKELFK
jgi:hypothetical protein